jgi:hypothetical protein
MLTGCEVRTAGSDGWIARDAAFARQIVDDCRQRELRCDLVDGAIGIDAQARLIAAWFGLSIQ